MRVASESYFTIVHSFYYGTRAKALKALFFVRKVIQNGWGRDMLLNFLDTDLYEREGKAITNFSKTLPSLQSDLAQQATKDPYVFNFFTMTEAYYQAWRQIAIWGPWNTIFRGWTMVPSSIGMSFLSAR